MHENDGDFLKGMNERMEGLYPGVTERIEKLKDEQLGREIGIESRAPQTGEMIFTSIGYVLPVNAEQTEHIILFRTGDIVVTAPWPQNPSTQINYADKYKENHSPSSIPFKTFEVGSPPIEDIV